jgi:hypothetical protein
VPQEEWARQSPAYLHSCTLGWYPHRWLGICPCGEGHRSPWLHGGAAVKVGGIA